MTRVIKKYPNRRLYDTEQSRYITLADLQKLVIESVDFEVKDATTGDDITRNILLQIITEQESGGEPLFTTELLMRFIRSYGHSVQDTLSSFLEQSMAVFDEQQKVLQEQVQNVVRDNPMASMMTEITQRNLEIWRDMQKQFFDAARQTKPKKPNDN